MPTKKKSTAMRGMRLDDATYKAILQAAKTRQFASPSAFMRAAINKELRGSDSALNESEQRISASLETELKGGPTGKYSATSAVRIRGCIGESYSQLPSGNG